MKITNAIINITSENPERMTAFYRDIVGLEPQPEEGEGALQVVPGLTLHVSGHGATHGQTKEPHRVLLDFFVDDVAAEESRLKSKGVNFIREQGVEWWGGVISTFADPDGNYCQIIQYDPSRATGNPEEQAAATA
jgi:predicted enzyme related to lactoylglutathione lyase